MKSGLKIYTSYVTQKNVESAIRQEILPIFIIRNIRNSEVIGKYSGTAVHFFQLAPSDMLFRNKRDGKIDMYDYKKLYTIEMSSVNFQDTIERLEFLASICNTDRVVLMGYGRDRETCHRSALADILNLSGILENSVDEIEL